MARKEYSIEKYNGETNSRHSVGTRSTGRQATAEAARLNRGRERGSSDHYSVKDVKKK